MLLHDEFLQLIQALPDSKRRAVSIILIIASEGDSFFPPLPHDRQDRLLDIFREFVEAFAEDSGRRT